MGKGFKNKKDISTKDHSLWGVATNNVVNQISSKPLERAADPMEAAVPHFLDLANMTFTFQ